MGKYIHVFVERIRRFGSYSLAEKLISASVALV